MEHKTQQNFPVNDSPFWLRIEFLVQRYGAIALTIIVIAGLLGFFSQGWLSENTVASADQKLTVQYDKFGRLMSDNTIKLTANAPTDSRLVFSLGVDFMQDVEIRTLQPQPLRMYSQGDDLMLEYARPTAARSFTIWLGLTPQRVGSSPQRFSLNGTSAVTINPFIWP